MMSHSELTVQTLANILKTSLVWRVVFAGQKFYPALDALTVMSRFYMIVQLIL